MVSIPIEPESPLQHKEANWFPDEKFEQTH
jgi:hypothetical protein